MHETVPVSVTASSSSDTLTQVVPIQEDPTAHVLLKRIVAFESTLRDHNNTPVDDSFWTDDVKSTTISAQECSLFSSTLLTSLVEDEARLLAWLSCNRPSFSLLEVCKKFDDLSKLLKEKVSESKQLKKALAKNSGAGAKLLKEKLGL